MAAGVPWLSTALLTPTMRRMLSASESNSVRRLMLFFAVVYTVEGIGQAKVGIVWQPLTHFLKELYGWTPLQVAASLSVLDVPWIIKPLYGAISDFVPLFGYRRRSYLLLSNTAAIAAFVWVTQVIAPGVLIFALTLTSIAMAISSTLCGALLVENGQRHNASAAFVNHAAVVNARRTSMTATAPTARLAPSSRLSIRISTSPVIRNVPTAGSR